MDSPSHEMNSIQYQLMVTAERNMKEDGGVCGVFQAGVWPSAVRGWLASQASDENHQTRPWVQLICVFSTADLAYSPQVKSPLPYVT